MVLAATQNSVKVKVELYSVSVLVVLLHVFIKPPQYQGHFSLPVHAFRILPK